MPTRLACAASLCLGVWGLSGAQPGAQSSQQVFLSVLGPDDAPVAGLTASDVQIVEDGTACRTLAVDPVQWPMSLTVLVDNGPATTSPMGPLRSGLRGLLEAVPDEVERSLVAIAPNPRWIVRPTTDRQALLAGVDLIVPDTGGGLFFDALSDAVDRLERAAADAFPVVVMVGSDYGGTPVRARAFERLQARVIERGITVHVAMVASPGTRVGPPTTAQQIEVGMAMAKVSGGRYEALASGSRLETLLPEWGRLIAQVRRRQRLQYRITYERPATVAGSPAISARLTRPGRGALSRARPISQPD